MYYQSSVAVYGATKDRERGKRTCTCSCVYIYIYIYNPVIGLSNLLCWFSLLLASEWRISWVSTCSIFCYSPIMGLYICVYNLYTFCIHFSWSSGVMWSSGVVLSKVCNRHEDWPGPWPWPGSGRVACNQNAVSNLFSFPTTTDTKQTLPFPGPTDRPCLPNLQV